MESKHVEISVTSTTLSMKVAGFDVSSAVKGFQLSLYSGDHVPTLELELRYTPATMSGPAKIILQDETVELLREMGWKPPAKPGLA